MEECLAHWKSQITVGNNVTTLKLHLSILGEDFDVEAFQGDYKGSERIRIQKALIVPPIISRIPGTSRPYRQWSSSAEFIPLKTINDQRNSSGWLEEETLILDYLEKMDKKLPNTAQYCKGDYSRILTLVYLESEDSPVGGFFFSPKLYEKLASMSFFMELILRKDDRS